MGTLAIVLWILALVAFLWSQTFNGTGPENGCAGALILLGAIALAVLGCIVGAFWLGAWMHR